MTVFNIGEFSVIELTCEDCGEREDIVIETELLDRFYAGETSELTRGEEELLKTGSHLACWERVFS